MNQEVSLKARELAQIIARSPEYITMRATEDAAGQDEGLSALMDRYNALRSRVEELSIEKETDFEAIDEVSRELETVQEQIRSQPMYQALQASRKAFSAMMAEVNGELSAVLNPNGGCSGSCAGCSGCG